MLGVVLVTVLSAVDADEDMDTLACRELVLCLFVRRRKQLFDAAMLDCAAWIGLKYLSGALS